MCLILGPDEGLKVRAVEELREADHRPHDDPCRVRRQNDEEGNGGTVGLYLPLININSQLLLKSVMVDGRHTERYSLCLNVM